jgi:hypothetical protein
MSRKDKEKHKVYPSNTEANDPSKDREDASGSRGGFRDMDDDALTTGRSNATERGSGLTTKNSVTGSDYDGQLST